MDKTEFEEFKEFFDKHGVDYETGHYDKRKSCITLFGTSLEFEDGRFIFMEDVDFGDQAPRKT